MENKKIKNNFFKAVSIISLIIAIISVISTVMIVIGSIINANLLVELLADENISGEFLTDLTLLKDNFALIISLICVYMVGYSIFNFLAFFKLRKYSNLTNEEAKMYSSRIIAWVVLFFIFGGLVCGILLLMGYLNIVKEQVITVDELELNEQQEKVEDSVIDKNQEKTVDSNKIMERLERLNKIKEMGGITDEEYNTLKQRIFNED